MARRLELMQMARQLETAAAADDWDGVARADEAIAAALPRLAAQGPWDAQERPAFALLRERHADALRRCGDSAAELGQRLAALRGQRDGWLAYAELEPEVAGRGAH